jgi:hypothetical protein
MRPTTARVDQGSSALQSLRERPWGGERSSAHVQHGLTGTVGVGRPRYGPTPLHPPRKRCLRTAQRKKSHVMRPSTARAVTASLQVISTRSRCILLTPPLHCRQDSRRGWHGWPLCASPPRAGPCLVCAQAEQSSCPYVWGLPRSVNHWEGHARGAMRPAERLTAYGQVTSDRHAGGG